MLNLSDKEIVTIMIDKVFNTHNRNLFQHFCEKLYSELEEYDQESMDKIISALEYNNVTWRDEPEDVDFKKMSKLELLYRESRLI